MTSERENRERQGDGEGRESKIERGEGEAGERES